MVQKIINKQKLYIINSSVLKVKDEESVAFRVKNNDYFGTAATIISLIRQMPRAGQTQKHVLKNLEDDLQILQKKYKIKKIKNKKGAR